MPTSTPSKPRKTALVAATRVELEPTVKALGLRWRGDVAVGAYAGKPIHALLTGMGRSRAKAKVSNLLKQERFERLIHLGFAGGLDWQLQAGQVLRISKLLGEDGQAMEVKPQPPNDATDNARDRAAHVLLTADQLVHSAAAKADLERKYHAHAVDMESLHVAQLCEQTNLDYQPLRVICDPADLALPRGAVRWVHSDGSTNRPAVLGHLFRRPSDLALVRTLGRNSQQASKRLAEVIGTWLSSP